MQYAIAIVQIYFHSGVQSQNKIGTGREINGFNVGRFRQKQTHVHPSLRCFCKRGKNSYARHKIRRCYIKIVLRASDIPKKIMVNITSAESRRIGEKRKFASRRKCGFESEKLAFRRHKPHPLKYRTHLGNHGTSHSHVRIPPVLHPFFKSDSPGMPHFAVHYQKFPVIPQKPGRKVSDAPGFYRIKEFYLYPLRFKLTLRLGI